MAAFISHPLEEDELSYVSPIGEFSVSQRSFSLFPSMPTSSANEIDQATPIHPVVATAEVEIKEGWARQNVSVHWYAHIGPLVSSA